VACGADPLQIMLDLQVPEPIVQLVGVEWLSIDEGEKESGGVSILSRVPALSMPQPKAPAEPFIHHQLCM